MRAIIFIGLFTAAVFPFNQLQLNNKLIIAVKKKSLYGVWCAIQQRADIHADNDRAWLIAASHGDLLMMKLLFLVGANIHADKDLALRCSVYGQDLDVVDFLLERGADVEVCNKYALPWAAEKSLWAIVACLLRYGANRRMLTAEQLSLMRNSLEAQEYIANEIEKALAKDDFSTIKLLEDIIPAESQFRFS